MSDNTRQLSGCIYLRVTKQDNLEVSCKISHFVTEEKQKRNEKVRDKMEVAK